MRAAYLVFLLLAFCLCGCARNYVITLQNGKKMTTASKPRLKQGYYVFKDAKGSPVYISEGRVREIAPAGMAGQGSARTFKSGPGQ